MNKYAIYCDSLEDEQMLKDWIKKEFNSNYYETVKVGCKSGTLIKQWKEVYDYYKSLQK